MIVACFFFGLSGCGSSAESQDEIHLEHIVPAHKPKDFEDLVEQLALRAPQLVQRVKPTASGVESDATALQEFSDIIGWIPELAADSELMKADFESTVITGNQLRSEFAEIQRTQETKAVDLTRLEFLIEELRKLVPVSQIRKEQMSPWPK